MRDVSKMLTEQILEFINRCEEGEFTHHDEQEGSYNELALKLFRYQFQHNLAYKKFCQAKKRTPLTVTRWEDIPPMPMKGYKELILFCDQKEEVKKVFRPWGTTTP